MIQLEPLHDRVVIKRTEDAGETRSGLYIPDAAKEKPQQGEAPTRRRPDPRKWEAHPSRSESRRPCALRKERGHGMDVIIGDEEYVIMREREILGRIGIIEKAKRARK
jgi:chaperonin GroES